MQYSLLSEHWFQFKTALKPKQDIDTSCMRADGLPLVKDKMIKHNIS